MNDDGDSSLDKSTLGSSSFGPSSSSFPAAATLKKGLLWQQKDKIFSRWKERFFVLTADYLNCFKKCAGSSRISEMGEFLFKVSHFNWELGSS
jgi:hypothetical protein